MIDGNSTILSASLNNNAKARRSYKSPLKQGGSPSSSIRHNINGKKGSVVLSVDDASIENEGASGTNLRTIFVRRRKV